jgi:pimeloyl-ACP methyl ester carboxylesterase
VPQSQELLGVRIEDHLLDRSVRHELLGKLHDAHAPGPRVYAEGGDARLEMAMPAPHELGEAECAHMEHVCMARSATSRCDVVGAKRAPQWDMEFDARHFSARIDGVRLHWVEVGHTTDKPAVVLLHGLTDSHRTWRELAPVLARDRRVLVPDLPGHGMSARPDATYELPWYAHVMTQWLESLNLTSVDLVGHSFGGGVGQVMLLEGAERIRRLVLVASGGLGREIAFILRLASIPRVVERFGQPFMGPCTTLALRSAVAELDDDEIERLSAMNAQSGSAMAFARTVRGIIDWRGQRHTFFQRANEVPKLPPIAVFWGDRDPIIPVSHAKALADAVEGVSVTLFEGCGHYPHYQRADAFAAALRDFLDDPAVRPASLRQKSRRIAERSAIASLVAACSSLRIFA